MALKTEMLGLAIATELPIVVINSQRAGPLRIDHHDWQLGGDREPEHLGLERHPGRSEERRVGKSVDLGGRRISALKIARQDSVATICEPDTRNATIAAE